MLRHRIEITFGMDGVRLSIEPPAEFTLPKPEEDKAALTTRTSGKLRTYSLSTNDFIMEEACPLTTFAVEVESPDALLKCTLGQSPVGERWADALITNKEPTYAVKVCVGGNEPVIIARSDQRSLAFEVPLPS